jgi:hypothetical protein
MSKRTAKTVFIDAPMPSTPDSRSFGEAGRDGIVYELSLACSIENQVE